jgi:hypothetical protein
MDVHQGGLSAAVTPGGECRQSAKRDIQHQHKNGDPKAAAGVLHGQCRAATVPELPIKLRDHKGHGNKRDSSSKDICLHLAKPRQCLQAGSPRMKITISPIINLCISVSVTTCCFDGSI